MNKDSQSPSDRAAQRSVDRAKRRLADKSQHEIYTEVQKQRLKNKQQEQQIIDSLIESVFARRSKVIRLNFWRGVAFGLGSALGGTIILAITLWFLSSVVDWFPLIGDFVREITKYAQ